MSDKIKSIIIPKDIIRAVQLTPGRTELTVSLKCGCIIYVQFGVWEGGKVHTMEDMSSKPVMRCGKQCVLGRLYTKRVMRSRDD